MHKQVLVDQATVMVTLVVLPAVQDLTIMSPTPVIRPLVHRRLRFPCPLTTA